VAKELLSYRLLWGFLTREGMRAGEAIALTWADLDLKRGRVRLDQNKTDDPQGRAHSQFGMAELLRSHLGTIGLREERPELFDDTPQRKRMRVHDLRGTFVIVALANNRTESWIAGSSTLTSPPSIRA